MKTSREKIILQVPLAQIREHELVQNLPKWESDSPDMLSLAEDIRLRGIDQPLIVVATDEDLFYLIDGRHRFAAAHIAPLESVPVIVVSEEDAPEIIINSLIQRRHYAKTVLAYLLIPLVKIAERGGDRKSKSAEQTLISTEVIAQQHGIARDTFYHGKEIFDIFQKRPDIRAKFEAPFLAGDIGYQGIKAGIEGRDRTKGKHRADPDYCSLICKEVSNFRSRFKMWENFAPASRQKVVTTVVSEMIEWPDDLRHSILAALTANPR